MRERKRGRRESTPLLRFGRPPDYHMNRQMVMSNCSEKASFGTEEEEKGSFLRALSSCRGSALTAVFEETVFVANSSSELVGRGSNERLSPTNSDVGRNQRLVPSVLFFFFSIIVCRRRCEWPQEQLGLVHRLLYWTRPPFESPVKVRESYGRTDK